jgi:hypothetical protein
MEIQRWAARKPGAEAAILVDDREPQLEWDAENKRLLLRADAVPDFVTPGAQYNYEVSLSQADVVQIVTRIFGQILHNAIK